VYDGSSIKLYVDGTLAATTDLAGAVISHSSVDLNIGENPTWTERHFEGKIDEIRIWRTARTAAQINKYKDEIPLCDAAFDLNAYYKITDITATELTDETGNGHTGTFHSYGSTSYWSSNGKALAENTISIGAQPQDVTVSAGNTAQFKVTATANNTLSYQWYEGKDIEYKDTSNSTIIHNNVRNIFVADDGAIYVPTEGGLSISTDGGTTFTNKTTADGLGNNDCNGVYVDGDTIYVATKGGLSISTDGGNSFTNKTIDDGLGSNGCNDVYEVAVVGRIYVATDGGLSISTNGGNTFTNKTTDDGLPTNQCFGNVDIAANGTVCVGNFGGLALYTPATKITGATTDTLTRSNVALSDNGNKYYAEITNGDCTETSNTATLTVETPLNVPSVKAHNIKVYPNPTTGVIQVSGVTSEVSYDIYSITGAEIAKGTLSADGKIDVSNISNGLYFLTFDNGNTVKFIKK
jgi:hypothetical protein